MSGFTVHIKDTDLTPNVRGFLDKLKPQAVKVGVFTADSAEKAYTAEFGDSENNVPARAFMRKTTEVLDDKVVTLRDLITPAIEKNNEDTLLDALGNIVKGIMRNVIETASYWAEANAQSTIERKGHAMPLRDTDEMLNDITFQVGSKE